MAKRCSLYHSEAIPHLPRIIDDMAHGHHERLARLIEQSRPPGVRSVGMQQSVECTEMAPFMTREELREIAGQISPALRQAALDQFGDIFERCRVWNVPPVTARAKEPVRSGIWVLVLSGAFDPATPPASARSTVETLAHHYLFTFPNSGHGLIRTNACTRELVAAFLVDPGHAPSAPCLAHLSGPVFETRGARR